MLISRKRHVVFVYGDERVERLDMSDIEIKQGLEIEEKIVAKLFQNHKNFIGNEWNKISKLYTLDKVVSLI